MEGYIKVHRQISENELWFGERFSKAQAWIDLLLLATYKPRTVFIRGVEIRLRAGELCYSQVSLAERWRWNVKTVSTYLSMLSHREMLETRIDNVTTVISIKNWNRYQSTGEQSGEQMETKTETNKKGKKGKNDLTLRKGETGATAIFDYYAEKVRSGARADAIRNIGKLLKSGFTEEQLRACIDRYAGNGMAQDPQYRIQANNFFGRAERFRDYLLPPDSKAHERAKGEGLTVAQRVRIAQEQKHDAR